MSDNKELYYIDFDKLFENYADKYYNEHKYEYSSPEDYARRDLDHVYHMWEKSPQVALGGISPSEFFGRIPKDELIDILKGSCVGDLNPCSLLFDRIASEPSLLNDLVKLAKKATDEKLLAVTVSLVIELGGADDGFYLDMIDRDIDSDIKEICTEVLCEHAERVKEELLSRAQKTDEIEKKELYAEVLTFCKPGDDRILALLRYLLANDQKVPYIVALIGRYGDDRACADLYKLIDTCSFAEFLEIRNSIEMMGGTVDEHCRDFTNDPLYKSYYGL
ncbi:MAG: hypothetical protein J1G01_04355 [Clostridiales bacterium]|nr:hypothetical protein [Clostridiales bacterium]